jgi:hypothetical protein
MAPYHHLDMLINNLNTEWERDHTTNLTYNIVLSIVSNSVEQTVRMPFLLHLKDPIDVGVNVVRGFDLCILLSMVRVVSQDLTAMANSSIAFPAISASS